MSSSDTLPNRTRIPLLRFPQLVRNEVFAFWDIFEIYEFSLLSKVTKSISKNMKKRNTSMSLEPFGEDHQVTLSSKDEDGGTLYQFSKCPSIEPSDQLLNESYDYHPISTENSVKTFGSLVEHIQDVFAPETNHVIFDNSSYRQVGEEELKSYLNWFNNNKKLGKIQNLYVDIKVPGFKVFLENWRVDVGMMDARFNESEVCTVDFKVDRLVVSDRAKWLDFNVLRRFDCCEIATENTFSNQDMHLLLKDWKEGKSNRRARLLWLGMGERAKWKKILEGLDAALRDLRTVRRSFRFNNNKELWDFHGGFDITRIDGKVATVGYCYFQVTDEDDPIEPYMLEEYDRISRVWNSVDNDEEEEIEDVIVVPEGVLNEYNTEQGYIESQKRQRKEGRRDFIMIVW
ncbi:hypothetical protein B9Z55_003652 [Caenorhabditis nigoni]|nr:hypothetical protein B9Z55_003652 [Caenorhabditis nigoni]